MPYFILVLIATVLGLAPAAAAMSPPPSSSGNLASNPDAHVRQGEVGLLPPPGEGTRIDKLDQHVHVVIADGFADVEVEEIYHNASSQSLEARYRLPLPRHAVLAEFSIQRGEDPVQHGEVIARARAREIYRDERARGNDAGLAEKDAYRYFTFQVTNVPAMGRVTIRHRYYQPLELEHGIGRFVYTREPGGTDDRAVDQFWQGTTDATGHRFSFACQVHSSVPLQEIRLPGHQDISVADQADNDTWSVAFEQKTSTGKDVVVYYRLADGLPGRVELIPYKPSPDAPGYFMLVLTPGMDLRPRLHGVDYTFVLDTSGSMSGKLGTLADGVQRALGRLRDSDRFRLVTFSDAAREILAMTPATTENVRAACTRVAALRTEGGTDLHEGLALGTRQLDDDRATCVVLVTDGVANQGVLAPRAFDELSRRADVRIFGFLMGNSANWPLMDIICRGSGGFYQAVSNQDDIVGHVLMAKEKMVRECLHDARLHIKGVHAYEMTDSLIGKVYHGQQMVLFGRYRDGGTAEVRLEARLTGTDRSYQTTFQFPDLATDRPEIERLWAMQRVEDIQRRCMLGEYDNDEADDAVRDIGVNYQIVTNQTAMLVLSDEAFERHGIDRDNRERTAREATARAARAQAAATPDRRVDHAQPMWNGPAHGISRPSRGGGGGGGAIGPWFVLALLGAAVLGRWRRRTAT